MDHLDRKAGWEIVAGFDREDRASRKFNARFLLVENRTVKPHQGAILTAQGGAPWRTHHEGKLDEVLTAWRALDVT